MKIIWTNFASETLTEIYSYYKDVAGESVARNIKTSIFAATKQLIKHPESGQIEESLESLKEGHRYLVDRNYKIVYKRVIEGLLKGY